MIGILPKLYPDELFYSFLSRYAVMNGLGVYRSITRDIYVNSITKPNALLLNRMTDNMLEKVAPQASLHEIIMNHTIFKWSARFIDFHRREKAYQAMLDMNTKALFDILSTLIRNQPLGNRRFLRYCPQCSADDRERRGETYFRVQHQIAEWKICPIHKCFLQSSSIELSGSTVTNFIPAELAISIDATSPLKCDNPLEIALSKYFYKVMKAPFDIENRGEVKELFGSRLQGKTYARKNGAIKIWKLTEDFNTFYQSIGIEREFWEIRRMIIGDSCNAYEVSLLAFFLGVPAIELCNYGVVKG